MVDFDFLAALTEEAGKAILEVYGTEFSVKEKEDRSPLTLADSRSHLIISKGLQSRYPDIPVLSEEGKEAPYSVRKDWGRFWLVDPLDGTKEFIKRNGEFTINIALIEGRLPIFGAIYIPVKDVLYLAARGAGCWEISSRGKRSLKVSPPSAGIPIRVVSSRSHASAKIDSILDLLPEHELLSRGSALKFCSIAAGEADFYPRFGPTWEWDTAAGQAIVTEAGGSMINFAGEPFAYNKPDLLNGPFLVASSLDWLTGTGILDRVTTLDLS